MCAAPMGMIAAGSQRAGGDVLAAWAEGLAARRGGVRGRGGLRFAFYGRVSTEDWQDPESSRARQLAAAVMLVAGRGVIVAEFFDAGQSRVLPWVRRPQAAEARKVHRRRWLVITMKQLSSPGSPDVEFDAYVPLTASWSNAGGLLDPPRYAALRDENGYLELKFHPETGILTEVVLAAAPGIQVEQGNLDPRSQGPDDLMPYLDPGDNFPAPGDRLEIRAHPGLPVRLLRARSRPLGRDRPRHLRNRRRPKPRGDRSTLDTSRTGISSRQLNGQ